MFVKRSSTNTRILYSLVERKHEDGIALPGYQVRSPLGDSVPALFMQVSGCRGGDTSGNKPLGDFCCNGWNEEKRQHILPLCQFQRDSIEDIV